MMGHFDQSRPHCLSSSNRFLFGVIALSVALFALHGWWLWQARAIALSENQVETSNLAKSLAQHTDDTLRAADAVVVDLRERLEAGQMSPAELDRLHQTMSIRLEGLRIVRSLLVLDTNGHPTSASVMQPGPTQVYDDRAYFEYHRTHTDRGLHIGQPIRARPENTQPENSWVITVSRRIDAADGRFAGVVTASISTTGLQDYFASFNIGNHGSVELSTTVGRIIVRSPPLGQTETSPSLTRGRFPISLLDGPGGSFRYLSAIDDVVRLGSYYQVDAYPLIVIVSHSMDDVLADWFSKAWLHFLVGAGLSLALVLLARELGRQVKARQSADLHYRLLADNSADAIILVNVDGKARYVSPAFTKLTGWTDREFLQSPWESRIHPEDHAVITTVQGKLKAGAPEIMTSFRYVCKDQFDLWVEAHIHIVIGSSSQNPSFVVTIRDISERKTAEKKIVDLTQDLIAQANTDSLTGLANRRCFDSRLDQEWRRASREANAISLILLDVDRFKSYNDLYGHQQGDRCLRRIAITIAPFVRRPADLVARYGGEEIVILLPGTHAAGAEHLAETIRATLASTMLEHAGNPPTNAITASFGVATVFPRISDSSVHAEDLIAAADTALYRAKRNGRNCVVSASQHHIIQHT
jgi:diguanylate cyclase (GGDEF)-like protein/PAS domain S-box-containing protein